MNEEPKTCPECKGSFQGDPIPPEKQEFEGDTHYSLLIAVTITGVYDGALFWRCPHCSCHMNRWPEGHYLHERAAAHMLRVV